MTFVILSVHSTLNKIARQHIFSPYIMFILRFMFWRIQWFCQVAVWQIYHLPNYSSSCPHQQPSAVGSYMKFTQEIPVLTTPSSVLFLPNYHSCTLKLCWHFPPHMLLQVLFLSHVLSHEDKDRWIPRISHSAVLYVSLSFPSNLFSSWSCLDSTDSADWVICLCVHSIHFLSLCCCSFQ